MNFIEFKQTDGTMGSINIYAIETVLEDEKGMANIYCFGHGEGYFYETLSTRKDIMNQIHKIKRLEMASSIMGHISAHGIYTSNGGYGHETETKVKFSLLAVDKLIEQNDVME